MNNKEQQLSPWATFCITTYRRPEFLKKQISCILQQTFHDFEIIISDNEQNGNAREIVMAFNDSRIRYYQNEENLGMVKSFNRSLSKAESEYVVMITDDDPVYPEMLQVLYDLTFLYPGYGAYFGGCDIRCENPLVARSSRLKVGTNSCLADLPIGTIRRYNGTEFPFAYFTGNLGCHILWSTGIVKRNIALKIGGMPDFGSPYNTDFGYIVLAGAQEGALLINTSLGTQVVHGTNYGYTESDYEKFYITPEGFYKWIIDRLPKENNYDGLNKHIETFLARWVVEYAVSIKKVLNEKNKADANFDNHLKKIFSIPYIKRWKVKYYIASRFPNLFEILIHIKKYFPRRR